MKLRSVFLTLTSVTRTGRVTLFLRDLNFPVLFAAFQNDDSKNLKTVEHMIAAGADVNAFCS